MKNKTIKMLAAGITLSTAAIAVTQVKILSNLRNSY